MAPALAATLSVAPWKTATRNTEVSNPSRSTARKAMPTSAMVEPAARAAAASPSRDAFSPRLWRFIQTIM